MDIGKAIRICRAHKGLTQAQLAKKAGLSVSYLSLLENGERDPAMSKIENISNALGVPMSILLFLGSGRQELAGVLSDEAIEKLAYAAIRLIQASADNDGQRALI